MPTQAADPYPQIEALLRDYCHALDDGEVGRWSGFFQDDATYQITTRENRESGYPLGIMLCEGRAMMHDRIKALQTANILSSAAAWLDQSVGDLRVIVYLIGMLSAIIDNVPLVAASQGMYEMTTYPMDHWMWQFMAYCAGVGGSGLIIGSAAGVAVMGMEKIEFIWYAKKIGILALLGYFAGAATYLVLV
jgi:hypothetical protein